MLSLKGVYVEGCVKGLEESWVRQLRTCGVVLAAVTETGSEEVQLLIAPQERVNELLPQYPNLIWIQLVDKGADSVDLAQIRARGILLTDGTMLYHPGYIHDPFKARDMIERNFRRYFAGEPLEGIVYQPERSLL